MKRVILIYAAIVFLLLGCKQSTKHHTDGAEASLTKAAVGNCKEGESLVYGTETFSSYTEDSMRGQGVISFTLDINDRLDILNEDDTKFGEIVLNEDMTYFTLTMPRKIVARKVVTSYDFAAFEFDAETLDSDKDYLHIYINHRIKKVKKSNIKFTYASWPDYIKNQLIKLKDCNQLFDASGKVNPKSKELTFVVTEVKGDEIKIKSTRDCLSDEVTFQNLEGKINWKSGGALMVDFAVCN